MKVNPESNEYAGTENALQKPWMYGFQKSLLLRENITLNSQMIFWRVSTGEFSSRFSINTAILFAEETKSVSLTGSPLSAQSNAQNTIHSFKHRSDQGFYVITGDNHLKMSKVAIAILQHPRPCKWPCRRTWIGRCGKRYARWADGAKREIQRSSPGIWWPACSAVHVQEMPRLNFFFFK